MIDLHTHTLFSDGELLPSELVRRAEVMGYKAIALTDHVDSSNIDLILPRIIRVCKTLNKFWKIRSIPGVEITHPPLQEIRRLVSFARQAGARIVVVHGETVSEPVIPGTNMRAIESGCDILAHPGLITAEDVRMAKKRGVHLEITTRKAHSATNRHVFKLASRIGAKLILNTDSHSPCDLVSDSDADRFLSRIGLDRGERTQLYKHALELARKAAIY